MISCIRIHSLQRQNIKELFEKEIKTAHLGFVKDEKMINVGKAKNFDEFIATYNSLKKEEKEYVR